MAIQKVDFSTITEELKEYLPQYLESQSVRIDRKHLFKCINPDHQDNNPSCGFVPGTDNKIFHCFACNVSGNIFLAAHFLEGKPLAGRGFISDNLMPLAKQFGIVVPTIDISDEELHVMEISRAYNNACTIIKSSPLTPIVQEKLLDLGWPNVVRQQLGIGSITSRKDYIDKMVKHYGHKEEFLREVDLLSPLFSESNLIYTVKDDNGAIVGFSARNLKFEEQSKAYEEGTESAKPSKYINTSARNPLYHKSKILYNFNVAKKYSPPLFIFEGQSDAVTAFCAGLRNACAIGSTAFTVEHLNLIIDTGVKHLVFVLDADQAGESGTERFVKLLEENVGGRVGLRVEIIIMPEGSDDPDSYIRKFGFEKGLEEFRKLEKIDIFSWSLRKAIRDGRDPITLAEEIVPLIVNEQSYIGRMKMTEQLATQTKLNKDALWREVLRLADNDLIKLEEEKTGIAKRMATSLLRNPKEISNILYDGQHEVEMLEKRKLGYDPQNILKAVEHIMESAARADGNPILNTGFRFLNEALDGGLPLQVFIPVPGKPNQGKSTLLDNLAISLIENNEDCIVFFHTIDDALTIRIPRMQGAKFNIPSRYFAKAHYYINNPPEKYPKFAEIYAEAQNWIFNLIQQERLILADAAMLPAQLPSLESWVKTLKEKHPNKQLVVMGDNFHLYDLPGDGKGEELQRAMSKFVKRMINENRCVGLFTMELPKEALRPGVRPRIGKIKGSSGPAFDANANFGVYNDMKDMGDRAELFWTDPNDMETVFGPNQELLTHPKRKPIIELVIDKSKLSSFSGSVFFRLDPETGRISECNEAEQQIMRERANASQGSKNDQNQSQGSTSFQRS